MFHLIVVLVLSLMVFLYTKLSVDLLFGISLITIYALSVMVDKEITFPELPLKKNKKQN